MDKNDKYIMYDCFLEKTEYLSADEILLKLGSLFDKEDQLIRQLGFVLVDNLDDSLFLTYISKISSRRVRLRVYKEYSPEIVDVYFYKEDYELVMNILKNSGLEYKGPHGRASSSWNIDNDIENQNKLKDIVINNLVPSDEYSAKRYILVPDDNVSQMKYFDNIETILRRNSANFECIENLTNTYKYSRYFVLYGLLSEKFITLQANSTYRSYLELFVENEDDESIVQILKDNNIDFFQIDQLKKFPYKYYYSRENNK